ncbi:hypothetical protein ACIA8I_39300 [Streptomyces rishiriensis]|uniref:hypothetical protein n=1 Tax=Streptomyces rishiriensis TaxID=68264 RepID=UPI00378E8D25
MAARLSEDPDVTVALIEAGPPARGRLFEIPAPFSQQLKTAFDWDFETEPEPRDVFGGVGTQVVADGIGVPAGVAQQTLHRPGPHMARLLGQLPAIFPLDARQQPEQVRTCRGLRLTRLSLPAIRAMTSSTSPATGQGLRCGPRPPHGLQESTQPLMITRRPFLLGAGSLHSS